MTAQPLQISLGLLNALQVAAAAAAGFAAAILVVVPAAKVGSAPSAQDTVEIASRAYVSVAAGRLRQTVGDARNAAMALRGDGEILPEVQRATRLREWLGVNSVYRDALFVAPDGTVRAASDERLVGRTVAQQGWFQRGRATGLSVVADGTGPDEPFGVVVALDEHGQGGLIRLDAAPSYFTEIDREVRATLSLPDSLGFVVTTPDSRIVSGTPSPFRTGASATTPMRASPEIGSPGWLVTAQSVPFASLPRGASGWLILVAGIVIVAGAAGLGYGSARYITRPLRRMLKGEDAEDGSGRSTRINEFAALSRIFTRHRRNTRLLIAGAGSQVARVEARLSAFEDVSGWACCEIDPETGLTLIDPRIKESGEGVPFSACFVATDRPKFERARVVALSEPGPHEVVLRLHDWPETQVQVRLHAATGAGEDRRLFALMRKVSDRDAETLPQPVEPRRNLVLRRVTDGIVHEFNDVLTVVLTNLTLLMRRHTLGDDPERLALRALTGARRGAALTRRMLHLVRGDDTGIALAEADLATTFEAYLPFLAANAIGDMPVLNRIPAGLPALLCSERIVELLLLNIAFHIRDMGLTGFAIAAVEGGPEVAPSTATSSWVRVLVSSGRRPETTILPVAQVSTISTAAALVAESGGIWQVIRDGTGAEPFLAEILLPAAPRAVERLPPPRSASMRILLVESDGLVRASVAEVLADLGHDVVQAASGPHALEVLARDSSFGALIADQSMPAMAGLQLAAAVVEHYPAIRIILASPHGQLPATADAFLRIDKPFRHEDLQIVLNDAASRARAA